MENAFGDITFDQPVGIVSPPGETNRIFILEKPGMIRVISDLAHPVATPFLDLTGRTQSSNESGLLGLAFHPGFATNRWFFVTYTAKGTAETNVVWRLSRFEASPSNPAIALPDSEVSLIAQDDEHDSHEGGDIRFGPDGYLYVSIGDEGIYYDWFNNSQRIDKDFFSGIIRIDVDNRPDSLPPNPHPSIVGAYKIPPDNPFVRAAQFNGNPVDPTQVRTEFYAVGLRNPWRFDFDPLTGALFVNDTGQTTAEEINLIVKGGNYGWVFQEGTQIFANLAPPNVDSLPILFPIASFERDTPSSAAAITGGLAYRGRKTPQLQGSYIFADFYGRIGRIHYDDSALMAQWRSLQDEQKMVDRILLSETPRLTAAQVEWEKDTSEEPIVWIPVDPDDVRSQNGVVFTKRADFSIVATGERPSTDVYTITASTTLTNIAGIQIEIIPRDALEQDGSNPPAALSEFTLEAIPSATEGISQAVPLQFVSGEVSARSWDPEKSADGKLETSWGTNVKPGEDSVKASYQTEFPLGFPQGTRLTFSLKQQFGGRFTIPAFRISVTTNSVPPPMAIQAIKNKSSDTRTLDEQRTLEAFYRSINPEIRALSKILFESNAVLGLFNEPKTDQAAWEQAWKEADAAHWMILNAESVFSTERAELVKLDDNSVLAQGNLPWTDTYLFQAKTFATNIARLRLEILPHETLEGGGPGRTSGGNTVITGLEVEAAPDRPRATLQRFSLENPSASFEQEGWSAAGLTDNNPQTGWAIAPHVGVGHSAIVDLTEPIRFAEGAVLVVRIKQEFGEATTLGRFRVSISSRSEREASDVPHHVATALRTPEEYRSESDKEAIRSYYLSISPIRQQAQKEKERVLALLSSRDPLLQSALDQWESEYHAQNRVWQVPSLEHASVDSALVSLTPQNDGSILAGGSHVWAPTYEISAWTSLTNITAVRLEVLPDASLTGGGPGRQAGGNFILTEFAMLAGPGNSSSAAIQQNFSQVTADYSQLDHDISNTIDNSPSTGWAISPRMARSHEAVFVPASPIRHPSGARLNFQLKHQTGDYLAIGRFRISVTDVSPAPGPDTTPGEIKARLGKAPQDRSAEDNLALRNYFLSIDPSMESLRNRAMELQMAGSVLSKNSRLEIEWLYTYPGISSFGIDPSDESILAVDLYGKILRLTYNKDGDPETLPETLSETGAFKDLATLAPVDGLLPYEINVPFWSDHAEKSRWFHLPPDSERLGFNALDPWSLPTGAVWVKHFDLELVKGSPESRRRLETRFVVRNDSGVYGITYRWDPDGREAHLVPAGGATETFQIIENGVVRTQVWNYPSRTQCLQCHTAAAGYALGFNTGQLNREVMTNGNRVNQIKLLELAGYLDHPISQDPASLPALAPADDQTASIEHRVRSYLQANCAQCHQPGTGIQASWDARFTPSLGSMKLVNNPPVHGPIGEADLLISPGSPERSILLQRIASLGASHMPPLATSVLNEEAIQLVRNWISNDLQKYEAFEDWQIRYFGAVNAPGAGPLDDPDHDGVGNFTEYMAATDPLDKSKSWGMSIALSNDVARISYPQIQNPSTLEWTTNLFDWNTWQVLPPPYNVPMMDPNNTLLIFEHPRQPSSEVYYRLKVQKPVPLP